MLRMLTFLILFAVGTAEASCGAGYEGTFAQGRIHIGNGDCDYPEAMIVVMRDGEEAPMVYPYKSECINIFDKYGKDIGFSCRKDGRSPLAGTRYRMRTFLKKNGVCDRPPLRYYACVRGCKLDAPNIFEDHTVECD